ncbi:MAG: hypothetical protein ACNYPI_08245 [Arenicellales bacterium WSBS_2016_MAG_OTU3]
MQQLILHSPDVCASVAAIGFTGPRGLAIASRVENAQALAIS